MQDARLPQETFGLARVEPSGDRGSNPIVAAGVVVVMLVMVVIPAALTLHSVRTPGKLVFENGNQENPSPYGYTISLLLFIVPILVIAFWFLRREGLEIPRQAFWRTVGILTLCGYGLDYIFAQWFFCFPKPGATLGIHAWALGRPVPIEEYCFYLTGFLAVLLLYVWMSEYWLAAYTVADYRGAARAMRRLVHFHPTSLVLGLALIGAAWFYKKHFAPVDERLGFPGYFTFLVAGAFVPAVSFFPVARRFINWRAFSLTLFFILLISLLWEATLALPYGWWNYQHYSMMGLFIGAWAQLPIEAVCVWIAVTYATTIVFEIAKLWQASGRPVREALFGPRGEKPRAA